MIYRALSLFRLAFIHGEQLCHVHVAEVLALANLGVRGILYKKRVRYVSGTLLKK